MYINIESSFSSYITNTILDRFEQLEKLLHNNIVYDNNNKLHEEFYLKGYISLKNTKNGVICRINPSGCDYYNKFSTINDMRHVEDLLRLV